MEEGDREYTEPDMGLNDFILTECFKKISSYERTVKDFQATNSPWSPSKKQTHKISPWE